MASCMKGQAGSRYAAACFCFIWHRLRLSEFPEVTEYPEVTGRWCEKWSEDRNLMISGFLFVGVNCGLLQVENFVVSLHL